MKDEITKIMRKGLRDSVSRSHYISDKSLDNKVTKILQLFNDKIDSAEDEIYKYLYEIFTINLPKTIDLPKDIINIIKEKINE